MQGKMKNSKPVNLKLYGVDLPWVKTSTHLGHELSEDCTMEQDMKEKRADFVRNSTDVRETFSFAQPSQILQAVRTYCGSLYGAMTWSLFSDKALQVFNCWSTCVKLAWGVTRATHKYLVDNFLSGGIPSMRSSTLACYWKFFQSVKKSSSLEVRVVASMASMDIRSSTGSNLSGIRRECKEDIGGQPDLVVKQMILGMGSDVPDRDRWRIGCLKKFLDERYQLLAKLQNTT